jgi:large subunit ribosomal protein L9
MQNAGDFTLYGKRGERTMKVLLLEDVVNLGLAGDVVTVADGYGRNYLIPRGFAQLASTGALKRAAQIRKAGERKRVRELAGAQAMAQRIEATTLTFQARAGETGKLYGSITTADLAEALERELGQEFDRRKIISDPLRQLGEHAVEIRLMTDVSPTLKVVIESEAGEVAALPEDEIASAEGEVVESPEEEIASTEGEVPEALQDEIAPIEDEVTSDQAS